MVQIECGNCGQLFSVDVEMWWAHPNEEARVLRCPHCSVWNVVTFIFRIIPKVHGIVHNKE